MGKNRFYILLIAWTLAVPSFGQTNRYMVFFKDKNGSGYSIDRPEEFLSERSLLRRERQHILITTRDIPVSDTYVTTLDLMDSVTVYFTTKWMNGVLVETDQSKIAVITALPFVRNVEYVAPGSKLGGSRVIRKLKIEADFMANGNNNSKEESDPQNALIGVDSMHKAGFLGQGMLIAIFDSGFEKVDQSSFYSHLYSNNKITATRDFIRATGNVYRYDNHGSRVLSCISAIKEGVFSGTAPQADVVLCVTEDVSTEYRVEEYNWLFAAEFADSIGVDVINSSVGYSYFDDETMDYTYDDLNGQTTVITKAAKMAAATGMLVVVSQGNEGNNFWKYMNAPADADSILAVGAVTYDLTRSSFSSYGPTSDGRIKPDVSALGTQVRVAYGEDIFFSNGTSFSSPMVAGLAAGFWQAWPDLTNIEVIEYLKMTASQADAPDTLIGYGVPDFVRAYNKAKINEGDLKGEFIVFPNPVTQKRVIYLYSDSLDSPGMIELAFYDLKGSTLSTTAVTVNGEKVPVEVDVSFLRPGIYIVNIINGEKRLKSKLVIL